MDGNPFSHKPFIFSNHVKVVPGCARLYAPTNPTARNAGMQSFPYLYIIITLQLHVYHSFQLDHGRYIAMTFEVTCLTQLPTAWPQLGRLKELPQSQPTFFAISTIASCGMQGMDFSSLHPQGNSTEKTMERLWMKSTL